MKKLKLRNCRDCAFLCKGWENWEHPDIQWFECRAVPSMENLTSFPFRRTRCKHFKKRKTNRVNGLFEKLEESERMGGR